MNLGILSHNGSKDINHTSIASPDVQLIRSKKRVPNGSCLHDYANLYFDARNPMMFKLQRRKDLCVLRISENVFQLPETVVSDRNAASNYVNYYPVTEINKLNFELIFSRDWRVPGDPIGYYIRKETKCAEVLVKDKVHPDLIIGAYVENNENEQILRNKGFEKEILINDDIFFRC